MKRHKSLASLSSDHHHGLRFAKYLCSVKEIKGLNIKEEFKEFFNNTLLKHFAEEEKYLVLPLKDEPLIIKMQEDHQKMERLYKTIIQNNDSLKENLYLFGEILEAHIRFEERELFPMIEKTLPEDVLNKLGAPLNRK